MHRRRLLQCLAAAPLLHACAAPGDVAPSPLQIMTVRGPIPATEMGVTLTHEHVIADTRPYATQVENPISPDPTDVIDAVLPHLLAIRAQGCRTLVDATGVGIGRDAAIVRRLSEASGLHMLCATGAYGAVNRQFLPSYAATESAEDLAHRWITEWRDGIGGGDVRPGFIKLSVDALPLDDLDKKLIRAGALTHHATGLTIGVHCGSGVSAFEQIGALARENVAPAAWIWIHAQNEPDVSLHIRAARAGAWISFDALRPDRAAAYVETITRMRREGLLDRVLISQDAGWYSVGEPGGGTIRPYSAVFTDLIPALREARFSEAEIATLFVENPANAFAMRVRAT